VSFTNSSSYKLRKLAELRGGEKAIVLGETNSTTVACRRFREPRHAHPRLCRCCSSWERARTELKKKDDREPWLPRMALLEGSSGHRCHGTP
jgi:hypothetical protein